MEFKKVDYSELNAKQKENYNFQKFAATMVDFGFESIKLSNDWNGADLLLHEMDNEGKTYKIQLKSRFNLDKKYWDKNIFIAFPNEGEWYIYNHDKMFVLMDEILLNDNKWKDYKTYSANKLSKKLKELLSEYLVPRL